MARDGFENTLQQVEFFYSISPISRSQVDHGQIIEDRKVVSLDGKEDHFFCVNELKSGACVSSPIMCVCVYIYIPVFKLMHFYLLFMISDDKRAMD